MLASVLFFAVWLIPYACAQLYQPCSGGHAHLFRPCWLSGACRTFEMIVHGLTESKSRGKKCFSRRSPISQSVLILSLAPELSFDRPRKNTGCFAVYQTSYNPKIYDTDTFVMRKPQLAALLVSVEGWLPRKAIASCGRLEKLLARY